MAKNYNWNYQRVEIAGRVAADPEFVKYDDTQNRRCRFTIASNRMNRSENGDVRKETLFLDVVAWNGLSDSLQRFLRKGSEIFVWGHLSSITKDDRRLFRLVAEGFLPGFNVEFDEPQDNSDHIVVDENTGEISYNK